jgi:diketogulonate reductase-like aldo/keto reductase
MITRPIPSTREQLPVIGLGSWQTFDVNDNSPKRGDLLDVLKILTGHKGSLVDSSPMYGRSEKVIGDLVEKSNLQEDIFFATKVWTTGKENGIRQMENSFSLFKTSSIHLMQIHNLLDWKTHLPTLKRYKDEGRIKYMGITHYHSGAYSQVEEVMKQEKWDFLQINYSITDREAEKKVLPLAEERGIAVLINRPFDTGKIFATIKNKKLPEWTKEFDCETWTDFFLKFILSNPAVTCVIPATANPNHMLLNVKAGTGALPDLKHREKMIQLITD